MKVLIAGQGLAGSVLALELISRGVDVKVADPLDVTSSTRVAAGVIRPITGRRIAKTYQAEISVPAAFEFYSEAERLTGARFIYRKDVLQLFQSASDANDWLGRMSEPGYDGFVGDFLKSSDFPAGYRHQTGGIFLTQCGYLDTGRFLDSIRDILIREKRFIKAKVTADALQHESGRLIFQDEKFDKVICCEGSYSLYGDFFPDIPFRLVKGEIIDFKADHLDERYIINFGKFILPVGNGSYRTGSTYSWHMLDDKPTAKVREMFEDFLKNTIEVPFEITGHLAGVRPAIVDRKPVAGFRPDKPELGIFNGLGSKGVMLGPLYARQLADLMIENKPVDPLISSDRFLKDMDTQ